MKCNLPDKLDRKEVLRYMGCLPAAEKELDHSLLQLIDSSAEKVRQTSEPRYTYKKFDLSQDGRLGGTRFAFSGRDIAVHLSGCYSCILLAVTLGSSLDTLIRTAQVRDLSEAVVLDYCASVLIEDICDQITETIREENAQKNCRITSRFSPGYGDMPLTDQNIFLNLLDTNRQIGLSVTAEFLMTPRKSVTAVIGIYPDKTE